MRITYYLLAFAVAVLAARQLAADDKPPTAEEEMKRLTGTWLMFDQEVEGGGDGQAWLKRIVFDGNKYTFYREMNKSGEFTFTLDPSADPRTIDVKNGSKTKQGIYRFHQGRLEICLAQDGKPRPKVFATHGEPGVGSILYVLKPKTPPDKLDPVEEVFQAEVKKLTGKWAASAREAGGRDDTNPENHGLLVEDGRLTTIYKGNAKDTMTILRVDPKADPPQIDFRVGSKLWQGIYRLSDDKFELCLPEISALKRPSAFTTKKSEAGAGQLSTVYQKEKK